VQLQHRYHPSTRLKKDVEIRMEPSEKLIEEIDIIGETCPGPVIIAGSVSQTLQ
jgi:hypothetical protein